MDAGGLNMERLTWAEVCARYPMQWVVLIEVDIDEVGMEIRSGIVAGHGRNREESFAQADPYIDGHSPFANMHTRPPDPPRVHDPRDLVWAVTR